MNMSTNTHQASFTADINTCKSENKANLYALKTNLENDSIQCYVFAYQYNDKLAK